MKKKASELRVGDRVVSAVRSAEHLDGKATRKVSVSVDRFHAYMDQDTLLEVLPPGYEDVIEAARDVVVNCSMHTLAHYEAVETLKTALRILDKAVKS